MHQVNTHMARKSANSSRSKRQSRPMRATASRQPKSQAPAAAQKEPAPVQSSALPASAPPATAMPAAPRAGQAGRQRGVTPNRQRGARGTARATQPAHSFAISREQEYGFIREDMRRLLLTAGALTLVMIALLMVIGR